MKYAFAITALSAAVGALPTESYHATYPETSHPKPHPKPKTCPSMPQDANFDDLTGVPGLIFNAIPTPYKGLYYQGIDFTTIIQTNLAPGIIPHSGTNYGAVNVISQLQGTPMITVNYPAGVSESTIESFQLESFYYGCVVQLATGAAALPNACTINVTGYKGDDNTVADSEQVCSQTYEYNPTTALGVQQQAFGKFDDCWGKDLTFATIQFSLPGGQAALGALSALVIDDLKYSTKEKSCTESQ